MQQFFSKISAYSFVILGVLAIFPLFIIGFYNHPSADDFCFMERAMNFGFWEHQAIWYTEWTGRYATTFLMCAYTSLARNFEGYWLLALIVLALFLHALYLFIKAVFPWATRLEQRSILLGLSTLYLYGMPSLVQGVFWFPGFITYHLPFTLIFYFCAFLLNGKTSNKFVLPFQVLGVVIIAAGSEISLVLWSVILFSGLVWLIYQKRKIPFLLLLFLGVTLIAGLASLLAPGNGLRAARWETSHDLLFSLEGSVVTSLWWIKRWLVETPVLPCFLLFFPVSLKWALNKGKSGVFRVHFIPLLLVIGALYWLCFFPAYYGLGAPPPRRTLNVAYLVFLVGGLVTVHALVCFYVEKFDARPYEIPVVFKAVLMGIVVLFFIRDNNIKTVYVDLFSGTAKEYNQEVLARLKMLPNCPVDDCLVSPYHHQPTTIFFDDVKRDATDWRNQCYAPVFKKEKIRLK